MKIKLLLKPGQRLFVFLFTYLITSGSLFAQGAGNAISFDGIDDVVIVPSSSGDELNPQKTITVECWVMLKEEASENHRPHLIAKNSSYALIVEDNGYPRFFIFDDQWYNTEGRTKIKPNIWYHIAGTYDGDSIRIYVNGKPNGIVTAHTGSMSQNDYNLKIGNRFDAEEASSAIIDEVKVWKSTRTESMIQMSMNKVLMNDTINLAGYWHFNESGGSIAADSSSWGNDGTLASMDTTAVWIQSIAPLGSYSKYAISKDIVRNTDVTVDVVFDTINSPGENYALAAIQINDSLLNTTGLTNVPDQYWELWSEDPLFDGTFSATVKFHYDNIFGIQDETLLELYRRNNAISATWEKVQGYTIESGSSSIDGKGYIQWAISQDTTGGFSGQYIISGGNPLIVERPDREFEIKLFPNPNHGSFEIGMYLDENQNVEIEIYSMNGKVIWKEIYLNQFGEQRFPIYLKEPVKGMYIIKISTKNDVFTKQLIVQ